MDQPNFDQSFDLRQYLSVLAARKWTILLTTCVVLGAALGFSFLQTPIYRADARLLVRPLSAPNSTVPQPVDSSTEGQIISSQPVAALVQKSLGTSDSTTSLIANLSVQPADSSTTTTFTTSAQVLIVSYSSPDAGFASQAANAFAQAYISYRRQQATQTFAAAQKTVQQRIQVASQQLNGVTQQLNDATKSGDQALVNTLETQRNIVISRLGVLQQHLDTLQPDQSVSSGGAQVIESAQTPSKPASPNFVKNGALAVVLGIAIGVGLAFLRERLDDRFRGRSDVERGLDVPVVGTIPKFSPKRGRKFELAAAYDHRGGVGESYRSLRTNLQFTLSQRGIKSVVVTSPSAGEGKTTTTANLGLVFAQAGQRTVLVSGDLRRPTLSNYFGLKESEGLTTFLTRGDSPWKYIKDPGISNLRVMPSGAIPANPAELLASPMLEEFIHALEENADVVLIDSPPTLAVADASILAGEAGGVVIVIDAVESRRSTTVHAKEEIQRGGGIVVGTVLNAFDPTSSPYYYSPYYYPSAKQPSSSSSNGEKTKDESSDPLIDFQS